MRFLLSINNKITPLLTQRDENGITHLSLRKFLKEGIY